MLVWSRLLWPTRTKFDWYFRYRAALLQVQHPKFHVDYYWGNEPITDVNIQLKNWENKVRAKKAKITETKNKMAIAENAWDQIFPIENEISWKNNKTKLLRLERELTDLVNLKPT